ncbi:MAG: hypothetical protein OEZ22_04340 [Spirochaetia bacterium]|nr:hypothetical protein [Spirochaetia bacterium]
MNLKNNNIPARKYISIILIFILLYLILISIQKIRAEKIYPIEKTVLWERLGAKIPENENLILLKKAYILNLEEYEYSMLLGKYYLFSSNNKFNKEKQNILNKAEEYFLKALKLNSTRIEIFSYLGWIYYAKGDLNKGDNYFTKGIEISPNNYFNRVYYGMSILEFINVLPFEMKYTQLYRASHEIRQAIKLNSNLLKNQNIIESLTKLSIMIDDKENALRYINQLKAFNVKNAHLYFYVIETQINNNEIEKVIHNYIKLFEKNKNDKLLSNIILKDIRKNTEKTKHPKLNFFLAEKYFEHSYYKDSVYYAEKSLKLNYRLDASHLLIAQSYEKLNLYKKSYEAYIKAHNLNKKNKIAEEKIIEFQKSKLKIY